MSTAYVVARKASADSKLLTINKCIVPKVLYPLKFMPWTTKRYNDIQKILDTAYKRATKTGRRFPTALLYVKDGLGQQDLTYLVQKTKMAMATRLLLHPDSKHVVESLIARAFRNAGKPTIPNVRQRLSEMDWKGATWYASVLEWNMTNDVQLELVGESVGAEHDSPFEAAAKNGITLTPETKTLIHTLGIGTCTEIPFNIEELAPLRNITSPTLVRAGQCWTTTQRAREGTLYEITRGCGFVTNMDSGL
jgi:hypothetical protein